MGGFKSGLYFECMLALVCWFCCGGIFLVFHFIFSSCITWYLSHCFLDCGIGRMAEGIRSQAKKLEMEKVFFS